MPVLLPGAQARAPRRGGRRRFARLFSPPYPQSPARAAPAAAQQIQPFFSITAGPFELRRVLRRAARCTEDAGFSRPAKEATSSAAARSAETNRRAQVHQRLVEVPGARPDERAPRPPQDFPETASSRRSTRRAFASRAAKAREGDAHQGARGGADARQGRRARKSRGISAVVADDFARGFLNHRAPVVAQSRPGPAPSRRAASSGRRETPQKAAVVWQHRLDPRPLQHGFGIQMARSRFFRHGRCAASGHQSSARPQAPGTPFTP